MEGYERARRTSVEANELREIYAFYEFTLLITL
jgi:hypothetical protein